MSTDTVKRTVDLPFKYGKIQSVLDWCDENCLGNRKLGAASWEVSNEPSWTFDFENETDYVLFMLTWK
jgi:hypothetical protein